MFVIVMIAMLGAIGFLTFLKYRRLRLEHKRWLDIKELEKDYDMFLADEY